jgi:hypothetical protein
LSNTPAGILVVAMVKLEEPGGVVVVVDIFALTLPQPATVTAAHKSKAGARTDLRNMAESLQDISTLETRMRRRNERAKGERIFLF